MRIDELTLVAYGKFTDHRLVLPRAAHDFHVVIGPNEAGKSTVRRAITELLFGMERQSPLGFKHPQSDLRLSAVLEAGEHKLAFIRSKQQKSLRSMEDEPLPDAYLSSALGALSEDIFEQLHCLSHGQLLKGGQSIIDPRNSVSQILFQAASGLEGFAPIREELDARAAALFLHRGRQNEYAKAADRYSAAQKTLREVQVRTKEWVEARDAQQQAEQALDIEREHRRALETRRATWERTRRLTPLIERLARLEAERQALGDTLAFPSNAKETLDSGISRLNAAAGTVKTREKDVVDRRQQLDDIHVDEQALARAGEIEHLSHLCSLYAQHPDDLASRRSEVRHWLNEVLARASEFGWGSSEEEVRARLPQDKTMRAMGSLLKERGALLAEERAARHVEAERLAAANELHESLNALPELAADPQLAQALALALPYKTTESKQQNLQAALAQAEKSAARAMAALGRPHLTEDALRSMQLPSAERVAAYRAERRQIANARDLAASRAQQHAGTADDLELQITQFVRSHKVVTAAEVSSARRDRDEQWSAIKSGVTVLPEAAPRLDAAMRLADELVDARTLSETDGATLQALRDRAEKERTEHARQQHATDAHASELSAFDARWAETASTMGLPGMELDDLTDWLTQRERALQVAETLATRRQDYEQERDQASQAKQALHQAISDSGLPTDAAPGLAALCAIAEAHLKSIEHAQTLRQSLTAQHHAARAALSSARQTKDARSEAFSSWNLKWTEVLAKAHLTDIGDDTGEIEAALEAARWIHQRLEKITTLRSERIEVMERDLQRLQEAADDLAQALTPGKSSSSPAELSGALLARLEEAKRQASRRAHAQEFLDQAGRQLSEAQSIQEQARRSLEPVLQVAGVHDPMEAIPLVEKAQKKTELELALSETRSELERDSDGLSLEQVRAEVSSHPAIDAPAQLQQLKDALDDSDRKLTQLAQAQLAAQQAVDAIHGGSQAAVAEAQKQEALADMSSASEEYLQYATASCLLRWAVDRYRDRKQGPLLQRASSIFKNLTLGSFEKLRIDYDQAPPALLAYRANNQAVKISGLSDGTRDQLFLALRIAALELQAEQGTAIPFIADDLFINFDEKRSLAGLQALHALSAKTQVLFLSHQEHLLPVVQQAFPQANVIRLEA